MKSIIQHVCVCIIISDSFIGNQVMAQSMYEKDLFTTGVGVLKKLSDIAVEKFSQGTDYETYFNEILILSHTETSVELGGRPLMTGTKRIRDMGIDKSDPSKTYSNTRSVNIDSNGMEIPKSEIIIIGAFTPIQGKQNWVCDEPARFEKHSLDVTTTYRVKNKVAIPARNIQKTAISSHNIVVVAEGAVVPSSCSGSETSRSWVIPIQVSRLGYTDFSWEYKDSIVRVLNAKYSRAEALAHQMFKDSYSALPTDQKAKVDAILKIK